MEQATVVNTAESGASLKWLCVHIGKGVRAYIGRHKLWAVVIALSAVFFGMLFREEWQPLVIWVRRFAAPATLSAVFIVLSWRFSRRMRWWWRGAVMLVACSLVAGFVGGYEYFSLWVRYQSFHVEEMDRMPETNHERIQPLMSVHALAEGVMGDSRNPAPPDFVSVNEGGKKGYKWTLGVEPKMWLDKVFGSVEEVFSVSATDASPQFTVETRIPVHFNVGERLWLSSNAHTAAVRSFGPEMFLHYEPDNVRYLKNDSGEIVEVISLLRWEGVFFPYPAFGGVIVVKQEPGFSFRDLVPSMRRFATRVALGAGEWIPPEQVREYPYLRGQNILPTRVSRYIAESLRFMNGIVAPFPGWHQGDVRIPESRDMNQQPYAVVFKTMNGLPEMIYHYFSLEPYLEGKHGLVVSLLIPADDTQRVFVYKHEERNESLIGASMVAGFVMDSKKNYNWEKSVPVEERPYVRYINGQRRFLWLTTVVTYKDREKKGFVTGIPEVVLVDSVSREVFWVNPEDQASWVKQISKN